MARYEIREGSQTAHCCFEATIVDTAQPVRLSIDGELYAPNGEQQYANICELLDRDYAQMICDALNFYESHK